MESPILLKIVSENRVSGKTHFYAIASQILCVADAVLFTERCEAALGKGSLKTLHGDLEARLGEYTSVDLGDDDADSKVLSLKLKALIFDTIHNIEV